MAHHRGWNGEDAGVEVRLRSGAVTVRAFLWERYGVYSGESEHGNKSDLRRFRLWLSDAFRRLTYEISEACEKKKPS